MMRSPPNDVAEYHKYETTGIKLQIQLTEGEQRSTCNGVWYGTEHEGRARLLQGLQIYDDKTRTKPTETNSS